MEDIEMNWVESPEKTLRSALGYEIGNIGELYNARNEEFCQLSLFSSEFGKRFIKTNDNKGSDTYYTSGDTLSEKFSLLNVSAELKLSTILKLDNLKFGGHAAFLNERKSSERDVSCTLFCHMSTECEKLYGPFEELRGYIQKDALYNNQYTHVVVGILWGANCFVSLGYHDSESNSKTKIEAALKAQLMQLGSIFKPEAKGSGSYDSFEEKIIKKTSINVSADVCPHEILWTKEKVENFLSSYSKYLKEANNGKGKPLTYILMPISTFKKLYGYKNIDSSTLNSIDYDFINRIVKFFEDLTVLKQKLNDLEKDYTEYADYLSLKYGEEIRSQKTKVTTKEKELRTGLSEAVPKVKRGEKNMKDLEELFDGYKSTTSDFQNSINKLSKRIMSKIKFIEVCKSKKIICLKREEELHFFMMRFDSDNDFFVLHLSLLGLICNLGISNRRGIPDPRPNPIHLFLSLAEKIQSPSKHFIMVDLNAVENNEKATGDKFVHYQNSQSCCLNACKHFITDEGTGNVELNPFLISEMVLLHFTLPLVLTISTGFRNILNKRPENVTLPGKEIEFVFPDYPICILEELL